MKIQVFVDRNYQVYSQEEVDGYAEKNIEESDIEIVKSFMRDIDIIGNINPLFRALREGDSEAFLDLSKKFQKFLGFYKDNYIDENFYKSYVEA